MDGGGPKIAPAGCRFEAVADAVADGGGLHLALAQRASDPSAEGVGARALFSGSFLPSVVAGTLSADLDSVEPGGLMIASWAGSLERIHSSTGLWVMLVRWPRVTSSTSRRRSCSRCLSQIS